MNTADTQWKPSSTVTLQVPFHDLDPLRVVWHGNYLKYFEIARDHLFESHGLNSYEYYRDSQYLFPVVRTATKHIHPLRYSDRFECQAELLEARVKLTVQYTIRLIEGGTLCAKGRTEQVAVRADTGTLEFSIPSDIQRLFGVPR